VAPGAGQYVAIQRDKGGHGSLIYPYPELGGTQATLELQSQVVQFALSSAFPAYPPCATSPDAGPPYLVVQDTSVIEPVQ
jgi:hypothetical protein